MKTIRVPDAIMLVDPKTRNEMYTKSFRDFAFEAWLNDSRVGSRPVALYRWQKVCKAFDDAVAGGTVEIEDAEFETLLAIVRAPAVEGPFLLMQCLPFSEAVEKAT